VLGDNTVLVSTDGQKLAILNHSVINYFVTNDEKFTEYIYTTLQILMKKSTLISETAERERQRFFDLVRYKIHENRKLV
jgi:urate oxidase